MRITIVTEAWHPQVNGVVTTLDSVVKRLNALGHQCTVIEPSLFNSVNMPGYGEIALVTTPWKVGSLISQSAPDSIHIATEGPLGIAARFYCQRNGWAFTTSLHTKFPEYINARIGLPVGWGYRFLRWFHKPSSATLTTTKSMVVELEKRGLKRLVEWGRGVDCDQFRPIQTTQARCRERKKLLYVGRIALEKNIEDFLRLPIDAEKIVVGDGPQRRQLQEKFPDARWLGYKYGDDLAACYAEADAFVFPSRTDTFGIVMLEALACGTPIAAYPVTGPIDIVESGANGVLSDDLEVSVLGALEIDRANCRAFALRCSWDAVAEIFATTLVLKTDLLPAERIKLSG